MHAQELSMCKKIGYEYYCEELFEFHYSKTDVKPTVLDDGYQIILQIGPAIKRLCVHITITF